MANETTDQIKIQTAEALEEAARKLRIADVSARNEDIRNILRDVEDRVNQFKADAGHNYKKMETNYHNALEPVENVIVDHPIPSVLIAACIGALIGFLISKACD
jgi:ElaB/YqjD/DUF883 family membrane-anchored ribosome-binding protein